MIPKTASMVMITQPRLAPFVKLDEREPGRSSERHRGDVQLGFQPQHQPGCLIF
jgi:hypothetical protein